MFFGDWLQRRASLSPNKTALIDALHDDKPITYQEWNRRTNKVNKQQLIEEFGNRQTTR